MSTRNDYTADQLADFARLLWPARMVLDACSGRRPGFEDEAADMAQRIVDLIGHGVSDEPPHALVELDELRAEVERLREENDRLRAIGNRVAGWKFTRSVPE